MKKLLFFLLLLPLFTLAQTEFVPGPYTKGDTVKVTSKNSLFKAAVTMAYASTIPSENKYWDYAGPIPIDPNALTLEKLDARLKAVEAKLNVTPTPDPVPQPGATYPLSFTQIPYSDPDINTPGRGVEQWHDRNDVNIPTEGLNSQRNDVYWRFAATRIATAQRGVYNWAWFDARFNEAIAKKQKVSFGIMTLYPEGNTEHGLASYDGGYSCYPQYLHALMQSEVTKDWKKGTAWVPNWNSPHFQAWSLEFYQAVNKHIYDMGWQNVVGYIDIRYGSWGEWHLVNIVNQFTEMTEALRPTAASMIGIIDAHIKGFPDFPLVIPFAAYDGSRLGHTMVPASVGYYALTAKNNWGLIGWRRDNWGITDEYTSFYTKTNTTTYNGVVFKDLIMTRYKFAYVVGEPPGWAISYANLESQIRESHATSFGNGNYGGIPDATNRNYLRAASKAAGYRLTLTGGEITISGTSFLNRALSITLNWQNIGIAPSYENWNVIYELIDAGGVVRLRYTSKFKPKLFLPLASPTSVTDTFYLYEQMTESTATGGTYKVNVKVVDTNGYRAPMPLAITGSASGYTLKTIQL